MENLFDSFDEVQFDLILDDYSSSIILAQRPNVTLIYPDRPLKDNKDTKMRGRFEYSTSLEMQINFRDSFLKAIKGKIYDFVLINSEEAIPAFFNVGYPCPVYVYSHFGSLIYPRDSQALYQNLHNQTRLYKDKITVLTQSEHNRQRLLQDFPDVEVCGMLLEDAVVNNADRGKGYGLVFNGRVSSEKNFPLFCKIASQVDMPVYVVTSNTTRAHNTAKELLEQEGVKEYHIRGGLRGKEKVDFLNRGNVLLLPSKYESFSYSTYESLTMHHVVIPEKLGWTKAFADLGAHRTSDYVSAINQIKNRPLCQYQVDSTIALHNENRERWRGVFNRTLERTSQSKKLGELMGDSDFITVSEYFAGLGREAVTSDIDSLVRQSDKYLLLHTENDTYICKGHVAALETDAFDDADGVDVTSFFSS